MVLNYEKVKGYERFPNDFNDKDNFPNPFNREKGLEGLIVRRKQEFQTYDLGI